MSAWNKLSKEIVVVRQPNKEVSVWERTKKVVDELKKDRHVRAGAHVVAVGKADVQVLKEGGMKVVNFMHCFGVGFAHKHSK